MEKVPTSTSTMDSDTALVTISALDAGHLTLPERLFVTDADPTKRTTVPTLSFLITHTSPECKTTRLLFDLGVKRNLEGYTPAQRAHISQRQPVIVSPDCAESLSQGGLQPTDIDIVLLSHVHWDHVGTPSDFPKSTFVVGSGTLDLLKNGGGPLYPAELFNDDELPSDRAVELPPVCCDATGPKHTPSPETLLGDLRKNWKWEPLSDFFPATLDFFGDGSVIVIDAPGHLYGHVNLLCRVSERKYVYLGGDCCHDPRILRNEKGIALYDDGKGGLRSVHVDTNIAAKTMERIRGFTTASLGVMGYPMAKSLRAGLGPEKTLLICDVNTEALKRFKAETSAAGHGPVEVIENGYEAVKAANIVITMLPGSAAVKSVYLDPKTGVLAGAIASSSSQEENKLIMECGTIESDTILSVASAVSSSSVSDKVTFVDAPVSGGPMGAQNATLTFMVGCSPAVSSTIFPLVKSLLEHMGNKDGIFLCGDVGAGTAFKIINNYLSAITSLAASEALNIGVKAGLDPKLLTEVINASGGQCWVTSKSNPVPGVQENVPSSRGYEGGFRIELCAKVLGMGTKLAADVGARTILDKPTLEAFKEAIEDERYKGKDARVVYKWLNGQ
ncbi:putative 3-hydroxyisobutyrate dehydrogenase protein [Podospora australis]|uniref:3-hydroxyisobutyrate dehydrogenase n=1 Tax=Podospora australis TaxID=1536484 RepID=A0AAN6WQI3_9PEZI|nr:putative 3-hydroxyisobutyrate dehydrogenase protein [Podospora australis]